MLRGNEVDVVAPLILQLQHYGGDLLRAVARCRAAGADGLADVVVLAEHAAQIAVREEDRARPVPSAKAVFLAEMRERAADDRVAAGLARGPAILEPIDTAVARACAAVGERRQGALDASSGRETNMPDGSAWDIANSISPMFN